MGTIEATASRPSRDESAALIIGVETTPGAVAFSGVAEPAHLSLIDERRIHFAKAALLEG